MSAIATEPHVLVIGYGNPLRGDDGVGWIAAGDIAGRHDAGAVATIQTHLLTPELSEPISRVELVIFIDAAENQPAGEIRETFVEPAAQPRSMTHHFSPQGLLALAEQLYGRCPRAILFSIGGADFGHGETLSATVAQARGRLVSRVEAAIGASLHKT